MPIKKLPDKSQLDMFLIFYNKNHQKCYYWNDFKDYPQYYEDLEEEHNTIVKRINKELLEK